MQRVLAIAGKDVRLLLRDRGGLFFTVGLPLLFAVFFGVVSAGFTGAAEGIDVLVIDEDHTDASRAFVDRLKEGEDFRVYPNVAEQPDGSEKTLTRDDAAALVRSGKRSAFIVLPAGFGDASRRMFWGDPMTIIVGVDPSQKARAGMITGLLTARAYSRMQDLFTNPAIMAEQSRRAIDAINADKDMPAATRAVLVPFLTSLDTFSKGLPNAAHADGAGGAAGGFQPVKIETVPITLKKSNPYSLTFPQGILWGMLGAAAGFGISLVAERTRGTLMRLRASPASPLEILAGKGLACFLVIVEMASALLILARLVFGVVPTSVPLLALAVVSCALCFVGVMMLMSMFKTEAAAGGGGWAILLVLAMIGGGMIPLEIMGGFLRTLSTFSPVSWAIRAMEGGLWRDFTLQQMLLPCGILIGVGIIGTLVGAAGFRWSAE
ncbi:MAG: ABC transporter permease [Phycisphaerales bacterium]|nr:ABC transporter permease [Phycisphaerales bacterium]